MTLVRDGCSFGLLLKTFRRRQHLTQHGLAESLGIHRNTLIRWEKGDCLPESKALVLEVAQPLHLDEQETRRLLEASLTAPSPFWHVPLPRNPFFTGREEILAALHTQLGVEQAAALTRSSALHGLGGVGKTQIALEYAYRHALVYNAVFWITAESDEQIVSSLLGIAEVLQLPEREQQNEPRVLAAVGRWFATHSQWLLIWDNVEDLEKMQRFLPSVRQGAILITTRCQALGILARGLDVLPLEQEEALLFVLRRAKALSPEAQQQGLQQFARHKPEMYATVVELIMELGGLPLALDQAGAYLEETRCTFSSYVALFRTHRAALLKARGELVYDHPASVCTTFTLALHATANLHPAVLDLLRVCALLSPDAIPEELFQKSGELLGAPLARACGETLEWDRLLALACRYSLLSRQPEAQTLSIHRLVQAVVLDTMTGEEQAQWEERVIAALEMAFPTVVSVSEATVWKWCKLLLPHALLRIEHTREACRTLPLADLASKIGCFLRLQEQDAEAELLFKRALAIQEQVLGPLHSDIASSLNNLAIGSFNQGKYEEVELLLARAISIREQALGPLHPEVAALYNNLAFILRELGKYREAEPLFARALAIREQALGPLHPQVASSLKNLADLYLEQGNYAQAEQCAQRAISIQEQALGSLHPQLVRTLDTLANLLREQGKYGEAEPLYLRGLSIWEQQLGPEHPGRASLLDDLAECYRLQQRDAEAEQLYRQSLAIREQATERAELYVSIPLHGLGNLARDRGHYEEAEQCYQRALALRERQLGEHHPDTASILHDLALLRQRQGELNEALTLAARALTIRSHTPGDAHAKTIATRTLCAQLIQQQRGAKIEAASAWCGEEIPDQHNQEHHSDRPSSSPFRNSPLHRFLDDCCELHPHAWCCSADLWQAYAQWVTRQQERYPLSRGAFIAHLKAHGCRADRTKSMRIWRGIALAKKNDDGG